MVRPLIWTLWTRENGSALKPSTIGSSFIDWPFMTSQLIPRALDGTIASSEANSEHFATLQEVSFSTSSFTSFKELAQNGLASRGQVRRVPLSFGAALRGLCASDLAISANELRMPAI